MNEKGKIAKIEWILLAATALFLCLLLGMFLRDRASMSAAGNGAAVETEIEVPQEAIQPDLAPLDLNSATEAELMELPGIGEELARRIVEYREANGPFSAVEDIMQVSGIGEGKFAGLEDRVTVVREETE